MKIFGVVAEYNPFHSGHAYHLSSIKKQADAVVVVMSGHAMQRGELSMFDKWSRANAALLYGGDLVLELPALFSCACAERFATGAISILNSLNCIDTISFGSESNDIEHLEEIAKKCALIDDSPEMKNLLKQGYSYPKARQLAIGEGAQVLSSPNNTLGIEYIKAAINLKADFSFETIKRIGAEHDSETPHETASASYLRKNPNMFENFIPPKALNLFTDPCHLPENIVLYRLRAMSVQDFKEVPDVTEGLENRLYRASRGALSLEDFFKQVKTKRYTYSRLRRIVIHCVLGIKKQNLIEIPKAARVLGFNQTGKEILSKIKKKATIEISPDFPALYNKHESQFAFDIKATDLFTLCLETPTACGLDFTHKPIII